MAVEQHFGSTRWVRDWSAPGRRILYTSNYTDGNTLIDGAFWNDHDSGSSQASPSRLALKDIAGHSTTCGLRTNTAFTGQVGDTGQSAVAGYPAIIWDRPYYTSSIAEIEIYGIPENNICDLVLGCGTSGSSSRGGTIRLIEDGRKSEFAARIDNAEWSGPHMFKGVEPLSGCIRLELERITSFCYFSFFDLRIYRR